MLNGQFSDYIAIERSNRVQDNRIILGKNNNILMEMYFRWRNDVCK